MFETPQVTLALPGPAASDGSDELALEVPVPVGWRAEPASGWIAGRYLGSRGASFEVRVEEDAWLPTTQEAFRAARGVASVEAFTPWDRPGGAIEATWTDPSGRTGTTLVGLRPSVSARGGRRRPRSASAVACGALLRDRAARPRGHRYRVELTVPDAGHRSSIQRILQSRWTSEHEVDSLSREGHEVENGFLVRDVRARLVGVVQPPLDWGRWPFALAFVGPRVDDPGSSVRTSFGSSPTTSGPGGLRQWCRSDPVWRVGARSASTSEGSGGIRDSRGFLGSRRIEDVRRSPLVAGDRRRFPTLPCPRRVHGVRARSTLGAASTWGEVSMERIGAEAVAAALAEAGDWSPDAAWGPLRGFRAASWGPAVDEQALWAVEPWDRSTGLLRDAERVFSDSGRFLFTRAVVPAGVPLPWTRGRRRGALVFDGPVAIPAVSERVAGSSRYEVRWAAAPDEVARARRRARRARGHVAVVGLGLGRLLLEVARRPVVERVTLVERDTELLDWLWPVIERKLGCAPVEVIEGADPADVLRELVVDCALTASPT